MLNNDKHNAWDALGGIMSKEDFLLIMPNFVQEKEKEKQKTEKADILDNMLNNDNHKAWEAIDGIITKEEI